MRPYLIKGKGYVESLLKETEDSMVCDLENAFDGIKVLPTTSASAGNQFIVTDSSGKNAFLKHYLAKRRSEKKTPEVFVKFIPDLDPVQENRMYIEAAIYSYLKTQLVELRVTPHIMKFIASTHCTNLAQILGLVINYRQKNGAANAASEDVLGSWGKQVDNTPMEVYSAIKNGNAKAVMLFLELGTGMSFMDLCRKKIFNPEEDLLPLLFQVGYTLKQMHIVGIRHNDLHWGNVWMDILPTEEIFQYDLGNGTYAQIKTKYMPKIYDFDLSTFTEDLKKNNLPAELENITLGDNFCPNYGMCSASDPLYDWLTFCYYTTKAMDSLDPKEKRKGLSMLADLKMNKSFLKNDGTYNVFGGRYCQWVPKLQECHPYGVVPDGLIVPFDTLVENGFFPFVHTGRPPSKVGRTVVTRRYKTLKGA